MLLTAGEHGKSLNTPFLLFSPALLPFGLMLCSQMVALLSPSPGWSKPHLLRTAGCTTGQPEGWLLAGQEA